MLKQILFLLLIANLSLYSQNKSIKISYKINSTYGSIENEFKSNSNYEPNLFDGVDNAVKELEYQFEVSNNCSQFYLKDKLYSNLKHARMAIGFAGRDKYFIDKNNNFFVKEVDFLGNKYYVSFTPQQNWTLTSETKMIEGYKCYKATMLRKFRIKFDKIKEYNIEAWYCPELPFSFGLKDLYGLPGIILELQDDKVTFIANKIELNTIDDKTFIKKSDFPEKKIMEEDEFYKFVDTSIKNYFDERLKK